MDNNTDSTGLFAQHLMEIRGILRDIPDFPKPGIIFRDITPLLNNGRLFSLALEMMLQNYNVKDIDAIAGIESRGFIFGAALAGKIGLPFVPVRKKGKLPWKTYEESFDLEYGTDTLAIHQDAFKSGQRVLLVDDLLATGGTAAAAINLIRKCGATPLGCTFLIELVFLKGIEKLKEIPVSSLIQY